MAIKKFEEFSAAEVTPVASTNAVEEAWKFDFQDWDSSDINGAGMEMAIDNLIEDTKAIIVKTIDAGVDDGTIGADIKEDAKRQAAKAIKELWIEKINKDL